MRNTPNGKRHEQVQAIGALETYVTENMGKLTAPTPPVLFAGAPTSLAEPSPGHGQHSRAIMDELGFDADTVEDMAQKGALYAPRPHYIRGRAAACRFARLADGVVSLYQR